jgi:hypothetical protein
MDSQTKRCTVCKRDLPVAFFHLMGGGRRRSDCSSCRNSLMKYSYVRDRDWLLDYRRRWYAANAGEHIARQRRAA